VANRTEKARLRQSESSKHPRVRAGGEGSATKNNPKVKHRNQTWENNAQK